MCINPVQRTITYKGNFSKKTVTVPCGKCDECRAKLQSEFAALSCLEAQSAGSIGFITLTYNNDSVPVQNTFYREFSGVDSDGKKVSCSEVLFDGFTRGFDFAGKTCSPVFNGTKLLNGEPADHYLTPSLRRFDVQSAIKRYRQDYFRRHGERCDFRFCFFGEYGERFHRPHYHMLVYGLDRVELDYLCKQWKFGFTDCRYIEHFNNDGSDAFAMVSRYVSKYVGKKDYLPDFVKAGYAEKPRKQSSIRLGRRDIDVDSLRNFISPATLQALTRLRDMKL